MYCVSLPIVILCMIAAFFVMLSSFWIEKWSKTFEEPYTCLVPIPSIVYSVLVQVMNMYYRKLATFLTEWGKFSYEDFYAEKINWNSPEQYSALVESDSRIEFLIVRDFRRCK